MSKICRFKFPESIDCEFIETQLAQAIISAECIYGQPKVRISASYIFSREKYQLAIDVSTEVGDHIAQVFTGLLTRYLGEERFTVDRISEDEKHY